MRQDTKNALIFQLNQSIRLHLAVRIGAAFYLYVGDSLSANKPIKTTSYLCRTPIRTTKRKGLNAESL